MLTSRTGSHAGDDFDRMFCTLLPRLYRRAALLIGEANAEDVVHDVYLKLSRRPRRMLEHPEPYAYVFSAVTSVAYDARRRGRRLVPLPEPDADTANSWDGGGIAEREAEIEALHLLGTLSIRQAAAVLLVDVDGYTIDQTAKMLGVHRGTVARARDRALKAMRARLTNDRPGQGDRSPG